jgi:4-amino-4-deoxy-L-arabinose transferase-like glycosyltransferase
MHHEPAQQEHKWLYFFIALAAFVNLSGLFVPLMDPDAGVYGVVAKNMVLRNNYLELYFQGNDWLDKPHFPFWITAGFFKVFGVHTWSYKLPGILFVFLGAWYTYRFAMQHYSKTIALWAVLILLTAEHIIISNNDVRAEPFLTGLVIAAIFHFSNALNKNLSWHLIAACFFSACAVMTKGPFILIPVGGAILGELIIKKNWKELFHWKWLVAFGLIIVFIVPELYSLWYQFDRHPEKTVFGRTGVSGIQFFLWDSQFGRFLNTGPIKGKGDLTFFFHTLLWAFLPWSLLMYAALFSRIKNGLKKSLPYNTRILQQEWFTISGSLLTIIVFSLSRFQLPYYTNIIFPLLAILTANFICKLEHKGSIPWQRIQNVLTVLLLFGGIALAVVYSPAINSKILLIIILFVACIPGLPIFLRVSHTGIAFYRAALAAMALNLFLNWVFYPDLLKYQSGSEAAFYINQNHKGTPGVVTGIYSPVYEFYLKDKWIKVDTSMRDVSSEARAGLWYVAPQELAYLNRAGIRYEIVKEIPEFHVTMLSLKFINKKTREGEVMKYLLIRIL